MNSSSDSSPVRPIAADTSLIFPFAEIDDITITSETKVLHEPYPARQHIIICYDRAALEGIQELRGVETEYFRIAKVANHVPLI